MSFFLLFFLALALVLATMSSSSATTREKRRVPAEVPTVTVPAKKTKVVSWPAPVDDDAFPPLPPLEGGDDEKEEKEDQHPPDTQLPLDGYDDIQGEGEGEEHKDAAAAAAAAAAALLTYSTKDAPVHPSEDKREKGDWIRETPEDHLMDVEDVAASLDHIGFLPHKSGKGSERIRYLTLTDEAAGKVTKGLHFMFTDRDTTDVPIKLMPPNPAMGIDKSCFSAMIRLTDSELDFLSLQGPFVTHLLRCIVNDPAGVFGSSHPFTQEVLQDLEVDEIELKELEAEEAEWLPTCPASKLAALQKKYEDKRAKLAQHARAIDSLRKKFRVSVSRKAKSGDPAEGFWPATWSCKLKDTGGFKRQSNGDEYPLYPTGDFYRVIEGAEIPECIYHHDHIPPRLSDNAKAGAVKAYETKLERWEQMHDAVAAVHPDGERVCELIKPRSTVSWIVTVLGIAIVGKTIDISRYISQVIVTGEASGSMSRPIGQPAPCLYTHTIKAEKKEV